ncbi:MAG: hypothetical protein AMXMBFR6_04890 [Betaproteobacteria bacterium]
MSQKLDVQAPGIAVHRFECGGAAEVWLAEQAAYGLWQTRRVVKASVALSGVRVPKLQTACGAAPG